MSRLQQTRHLQPLVELNADIPKQEMTYELTAGAVWSAPFKDGKCAFLSTSSYPTFNLVGTSKIEASLTHISPSSFHNRSSHCSKLFALSVDNICLQASHSPDQPSSFHLRQSGHPIIATASALRQILFPAHPHVSLPWTSIDPLQLKDRSSGEVISFLRNCKNVKFSVVGAKYLVFGIRM